MFLNSNKDAINKGAALTKDGYVKTASNMYWGISPLKSYDSKKTLRHVLQRIYILKIHMSELEEQKDI